MSNQYPYQFSTQNPGQSYQQPPGQSYRQTLPYNQYPTQQNVNLPYPQQQQQQQQQYQQLNQQQQFYNTQQQQQIPQQQNQQNFFPINYQQQQQNYENQIPQQCDPGRFGNQIQQQNAMIFSTQQQSSELIKFREEKKALKTQIDKYEDEQEKSRKIIQKLEHENSMQITQVTNLQEKLTKKKQKSKQLKEKIQQTEQEKKKKDKDLKEKNNQNTELSQQLESIKQRLQSDQTQVAQISDLEQQQFKDKILDQQKQLTELQEKYDKLEQQHQKECESLRTQIAQEQQEVQDLRKKLEEEQQYSNTRLEEILKQKKEIKEWKIKLDQKEATLKVSTNSIKEYQIIEKNLEQKIKYNQEEIQELTNQVNQKNTQFSKTLELFSKYQSGEELSRFLQKMQNDWAQQEKDYQLTQEKRQYNRQIDEQNKIEFQKKQKHMEQQKQEQLQAINKNRKQIAKTLMNKMKQSHGVIELCFVIDITGSMSPYKEQTQRCIQETIKNIKELTNREVHFAAVCYVDINNKKSPTEIYQQHNFTKNSLEIEQYLKSVKCYGGGGDACEDVAGGLKQMCELSWSKPFRMAILICDYPGHGTRFNGNLSDLYPNNGPYLENALEQMVKQEIMLVGLNFTKDTVVMYNEFEKIFQQHGRSDMFMTADLAKVSQGNIWKEMVSQIATASVVATQTNSKATKSKNAQANCEQTKDSAIEALCKAGNFYDFDKQANVIIRETTFKVYTVNLKESSFQDHVQEIEKLKSEGHYELNDQGNWPCIRTQLPFAFGMMKQVFLMKKKNALADELYVIKTPLNGQTYKTKQDAINECRSHLICQSLMRMYIKDIKNALEDRGEPNIYPNVIYSDFLILEEKPDSYWIAERFFKGEFVKYNNNYGYINDDEQTPIYQLALGFSYYTYFKSDFNYMVVDVQGVGNYFTDPAINTTKGTFDETDMGEDGIARFMIPFELKKRMCSDILQNLLQIDID